jgi:hypothetical protein
MATTKKPKTRADKLAELYKLRTLLAAKEAEYADAIAEGEEINKAFAEFSRIRLLVDHDIRGGADPEQMIEMLLNPYLETQTKPERIKVVEDYIASLRSR